MADRCHWIRDDGFDVLIPMCVGCATSGLAGCTCAVPESRIEAAERGRSIAEQHVEKLREGRDLRLEEQKRNWDTIRRLRARIRELETAHAL